MASRDDRGEVQKDHTEWLATTHTPLGPHPLWNRTHPVEHLPDYVENIAAAIMRRGISEEHAIPMAIAAVEKWKKSDAQHIRPEVREAARKADQEWEGLKAERQSRRGEDDTQRKDAALQLKQRRQDVPLKLMRPVPVPGEVGVLPYRKIKRLMAPDFADGAG